MAGQFEVDDYDYDKLQKISRQSDQFQDDLKYLIGENNSASTKSDQLHEAERKSKSSVKRKAAEGHIPNEISDRRAFFVQKVKVSQILDGIEDLGLSSEEEDVKLLPRRKPTNFKHNEFKQAVSDQASKEGADPDSSENTPEPPDRPKFKKKTNSKPLSPGPSNVPSSPECVQDLNDVDEVTRLGLSRKQRDAYRILVAEHNIKCQTKEELLERSAQLGVVGRQRNWDKTSKAQQKSPSAKQTPLKDNKKKKRSLSLLSNNPEFYNEHTTRDYNIGDLKNLPFSDDVIKTVILKASPKLKKLIALFISKSQFFDDERDVKLFAESAIRIALSVSTHLTARFNGMPILTELADQKSKVFLTLHKLGDEVIKTDGFLNIDLLGLLGNILIWWNHYSATPKRQYFKINHWTKFSGSAVREVLGGSHLWDPQSFQNDSIYDSRWEVLEQLRKDYRYEEDQFLITLRLMNVDLYF